MHDQDRKVSPPIDGVRCPNGVNSQQQNRAATDAHLCMFRCLDIVDPDHSEKGVILRLEDEIRSVVKTDGTLYKSCPFDAIPPEYSSFIAGVN